MNKKLYIGSILFLIIAIFFIIYYYEKKIDNSKSKMEKRINEIRISNSKTNSEKYDNKYRILRQMDMKLYDSIIIDCIEKNNKGEMLLYSIIMSNDYNYGEGSYNVLTTLASLYKKNKYLETIPNLDSLDVNTQKLAIHYLIKASENGPLNAKYVLGKYYLEGKYVNKDIELGKKLLKEAKTLSDGMLDEVK